jgi:hypothetical protein
MDPVWLILIGSTLVHAIGLAWVARHEAAKLLAVWRRRRTTASDLDGAMFSVWLHGDWTWLTKKMTAEEREAAVEAVIRYSTVVRAGESGGEPVARETLAWWEN